MNIPDLPWSVPLRVRLQCGVERTFSSVYEAVDFLENEWPLRNGAWYERAIGLCRDALSRLAPAALAREAFAAACLEAGMPIVAQRPAGLTPATRRKAA
ncbi:DUF982 domain-containing protein [Shinella sp.]|uniref:DUF982 domain-containing protein n=1 Tax=Shinella sp. TaxID=1870904 RepID=UPI00301D0072